LILQSGDLKGATGIEQSRAVPASSNSAACCHPSSSSSYLPAEDDDFYFHPLHGVIQTLTWVWGGVPFEIGSASIHLERFSTPFSFTIPYLQERS
jgi:hypothetical protein